MYLIFDRMCPSCKCSGIAPIGIGIYYASSSTAPIAEPEPRIAYEGQCEHCGGSVFRGPHGSLHSCPVSIPFSERDTAIELPALTTRASNFEEVTSERASKIYQCVYQAIWEHASS